MRTASEQSTISESYLQQLLAHIDEHRTAESEQAVVAAGCVTEQGVPQPHAVREGELLSQQQGDPPKRVELGIDLQRTSSITTAGLMEGLQ